MCRQYNEGTDRKTIDQSTSTKKYCVYCEYFLQPCRSNFSAVRLTSAVTELSQHNYTATDSQPHKQISGHSALWCDTNYLRSDNGSALFKQIFLITQLEPPPPIQPNANTQHIYLSLSLFPALIFTFVLTCIHQMPNCFKGSSFRHQMTA